MCAGTKACACDDTGVKTHSWLKRRQFPHLPSADESNPEQRIYGFISEVSKYEAAHLGSAEKESGDDLYTFRRRQYLQAIAVRCLGAGGGTGIIGSLGTCAHISLGGGSCCGYI